MRRTRRLLLASGIAAVLAIVPFGFTADRGLVPNEACAAGTCCYQPGALCTDSSPATPNYYNKGCAGPCGTECET